MSLLKNLTSDGLLNSTFQYYLMPLFYMLGFFSKETGANPWILIVVAFVLVPLCDQLLQHDLRNPTKQEEEKLAKSLKFKLPLYTCVFLDWFVTFSTIAEVVENYDKLTIFNIVGMTIGVGLFAGSNINVCHELIHKDGDILDFTLGYLTLSKNLYLHWITEHLYGHHKMVATPDDPATAKMNQTLYEFLPQTIVGTWRSAWRIEAHRIRETYKTQNIFRIENKMLWNIFLYVTFPYLVYKVYGFLGMVIFLAIETIGMLLLETINYVEHYGLLRKKQPDGNYEPVNYTHSWNAPHRISNYFFFKLQRHSDHHANAHKPYQILQTYQDSPHLPQGYMMMVILAWYPKLFFEIMNETLERYNTRQFTKEFTDRINKKSMKFVLQSSAVLIGFAILGDLARKMQPK